MINEIIYAISRALNEEFGEGRVKSVIMDIAMRFTWRKSVRI